MTAGGDVLDIKGNDDHDVCLKLHFSNERKGVKSKWIFLDPWNF